MSAGCHALLRAGAALCESVDDVIAELPGLPWQRTTDASDAAPDLTRDPVVAAVLGLVTREPSRLDDIAQASGLAGPVVAAALGRLELAGLIDRRDGDRYAVRR